MTLAELLVVPLRNEYDPIVAFNEVWRGWLGAFMFNDLDVCFFLALHNHKVKH
jgi:hypothetical protein